MIATPAHIGRYELQAEIGRGGAGTVWRALDPLLQRSVAIKLLSSFPREDGIDDSTPRFLAEARAIARLVHQNIVVLYDYGSETGRHWLAMQHVAGESLAHRIRGESTLSVTKTIEIARQMLRALRYAHGQHVLHRDVKSSNILLEDHGGQALLGDFGIALLEDADRLTTEGVALGTPEYMSPEQCRGQPLDERSDLYSLGIVLYECLVGKPPFLAEAPLAIAYKHVHDAPAEITRSDVPAAFKEILRKAMSKRPEDRYSSAESMLQAFDVLLSERPRTASSGISIVAPDSRSGRERRFGQRRHADRRKSPRRDEDPTFHTKSWQMDASFWLSALALTTSLGTFALLAWALFFRHALP